MESLDSYFKFFIGLIAIVNPVGAVPIFLEACQGNTTKERHSTGNQASFTVATVLMIGLVSGELVLHFFGISMASFRVAGGILILLMSLSMLQAKVSPAKQTPEEADVLETKEAVAIVPLGIPLMAGPGAISTVVLYAQRHNTLSHYLALSIGILGVGICVWLILRVAPAIADRLGKTGINIITRIMGLLMAAIGIEFMANGLRILFPGLV